MSRTTPTPPRALAAFDALIENGFSTIEHGLDAIDGTLEGFAAAGRPIDTLSVRNWIEIMRKISGTSWERIARRTLPWTWAFSADFRDTSSIVRPCGGAHVCFAKPAFSDPEYRAMLAAYYVLKAERRAPWAAIDRAFRRFKHMTDCATKVPGYDLTSAFDWYVIFVATLVRSGLAVVGFDGSLNLPRPLALEVDVR